MNYERTPHFKREFQKLNQDVRDAFEKQVQFLLLDIRHPSLRAKKYDETRDIWQARVTRNVRMYFTIRGGTYILVNIKRHND